jgi:hypothetical protein
MNNDFEVIGENAAALFTLKLHRGDGMLLIAMNWKTDKPANDFVGFAIEYKEPGATEFVPVWNRVSFTEPSATTGSQPSLVAPIQKFRWVHFPLHADLPGNFTYRVTPVFMGDDDALRYGDAQQADIVLARETYPGQLNVAFTRGFVSSQSFVEHYQKDGDIKTLLPAKAADGLLFKPTHPDAQDAYDWMGFEARSVILEVLKEAIADETCQVHAIAYDLNEPEIVDRLEQLGQRLTMIVDNSADHGTADSPESQAALRLTSSSGKTVTRQHMGSLQHNKTIIVSGDSLNKVVCGSTNFSWRGFFVQNNNALVLTGPEAVKPFRAAFDQYRLSDDAGDFGGAPSAKWHDIGLAGIDAQVAFSPHATDNALLSVIGSDIAEHTTSSLFYALAFLAQTPGVIEDAIKTVTDNDQLFVYGIADQDVDGLEVRTPDGNLAPVSPSALKEHVPPPFEPEPTGGQGIRLHHKFVVIDFDKPAARVYLGSYNFSNAADTKNGENLLLIRDRRVAVSFMVEAVRIFDHYEFRHLQQSAATAQKGLQLRKPPRKPGETAWWDDSYSKPQKMRDRLLFA